MLSPPSSFFFSSHCQKLELKTLLTAVRVILANKKGGGGVRFGDADFPWLACKLQNLVLRTFLHSLAAEENKLVLPRRKHVI